MDTNLDNKDIDNKDIDNKVKDTPAPEDKKEEVVQVKKADLDDLLAKVGKIGDIEKMLQNAEVEKKALKFENLKTKHSLNDDVCGLLGITADTKEEDIVSKVAKFKELAGADKDSAVFLKTDTTKSTNQDKYDALIAKKDLKSSMAALALKINKK